MLAHALNDGEFGWVARGVGESGGGWEGGGGNKPGIVATIGEKSCNKKSPTKEGGSKINDVNEKRDRSEKKQKEKEKEKEKEEL
ncbi:hypothetical protein HZH68_005580 [Vespula germanica]|uniref:Uncharacterized protein n=1 Tax=Vespula germanica TaxID=30212 RepID=A0A834KHZ6_VESGE|nr:hypothetical protein HZH68_005580 [Vespula germanica]